MRIAMLTVCLSATLMLSACEKSEDAATAPLPAADPAATPAAPAMNGDAIGVAECDDYLTRYQACLSENVPESARAALKQSLDATRAGWQQAAATPAGRESLASACAQMITASRQSMQAYGCTDF